MTLRLTLTIHPAGDPSRARVVGEATACRRCRGRGAFDRLIGWEPCPVCFGAGKVTAEDAKRVLDEWRKR